ncbi:hypothetical protein ABFS83_14G034600 [Erythranthe nasuta]
MEITRRKYSPRYRFIPKYEYLNISIDYLLKKFGNQPIPVDVDDTRVVDSYKHNRLINSGQHSPHGHSNEWYFSALRNKKHPNRSKLDRKADNGYWRAIRADKPIYNRREKGLRK